jgi:hypothetical protein
MRGPCDRRRQEEVRQGLVRHRREQHPQRGRRFDRGHALHHQVERQQHQPDADADGDPAEVAGAGAAAATEGQHPGQDQRREDGGDVEGERLHDQRRADIGAEHGGEGRRQRDRPASGEGADHQRGRRAALDRRGDAEPGEEGALLPAQRHAEPVLQAAAEGALDAALHHVQPPEQQRRLPRQFQQQPRFRHSPANSSRRPGYGRS